MYKSFLYEVKNNIATITINKPEAMNSFGDPDYIELAEVFKRADADEDVRAVVFTGAGRLFSGGGDVKYFRELIDSQISEVDFTALAYHTSYAWKAIRTCRKPCIAMINGACFGAGLSVALACDFRIVSPSSKLCAAFIKMAFSGDTGIWYLLREIVGLAKATEIAMLGDVYSGEEAVQMGLATRMAPTDEELVEVTYKFAERLAAGPTQTYGLQKMLSWTTFFCEFERYIVPEAQYMAKCSNSKDFEEAVDAFLGKRPPKFTGK